MPLPIHGNNFVTILLTTRELVSTQSLRGVMVISTIGARVIRISI